MPVGVPAVAIQTSPRLCAETSRIHDGHLVTKRVTSAKLPVAQEFPVQLRAPLLQHSG